MNSRAMTIFPQTPSAASASQSPCEVLLESRSTLNTDPQAQLLRDSQDIWFRFCVANLHEVDLATEAVQETAVRVLQNLRAFEDRSTFRTWSLGIALNVCREIRRRQARYLKDASLARPATSAEEPPSQACQAEQIQQVQAFLKSLPPRQREVVTLRYFEGLSVEQSATVMKCAAGTVKATLSQAISNLRKRWERSS